MTPADLNRRLRRRVRAPLGKIRRRVRRTWWNRLTGREYRRWLEIGKSLSPGSVDNAVRISVIVPVFNPPLAFLRECIDSVRSQTARSWELIVSDDGSTDPDVVRFIEELQADPGDARIRVVRAPNTGISAAQNRALELVTSEFFGWLDHDDCLDPRAIEEMSAEIAASSRNVLIAYSDEDKIDTQGRHYDVCCKPDFSPELLMSQMYICHFTVFRTAAVREIGGFRSEMDGAQDFDLTLRLAEHFESDAVVHVPRPLYHWRAWSESTAASIDAKPWAQEATARAQQAHLDARGSGGTVSPSSIRGLNDVRPAVLERPGISVIIPTAGTRDRTGRRYVDAAVRSLAAATDVDLEIIAVTTNVIDPIPGVHHQVVYETTLFNFAEAINLGRAHARSPLILLLNDDTELVEPESLTRMVELIQILGVGIVGAKLTYPDGRLQHVGMVLLPTGPTHARIGKPGSDTGYFGSTLTPRNFSAVTAAAMLVRREVFDALGGFDVTFARDYNDVDFCLRAGAAGHRVAWTPYAHFIHHEGVSIVRRVPYPSEQRVFMERWSDALAHDPYYSPALHASIDRLYEPR